MAPTLYSLGLEYVIRKMPAGKEDLLTNKCVQLVTYANDINIISVEAMEDTYTELKQSAQQVG